MHMRVIHMLEALVMSMDLLAGLIAWQDLLPVIHFSEVSVSKLLNQTF